MIGKNQKKKKTGILTSKNLIFQNQRLKKAAGTAGKKAAREKMMTLAVDDEFKDWIFSMIQGFDDDDDDF